MTDWQIASLIKAAVKRAEAIQAASGQGVPKSRKMNKDKPIPMTRDEYIQGGLLQFGANAEHWGKAYDEQAAEWEANRAKRLERRESQTEGVC